MGFKLHIKLEVRSAKVHRIHHLFHHVPSFSYLPPLGYIAVIARMLRPHV